MFEMVVAALLWVSALSCGLLAGLYFAFSGFIMRALARIGPEAGPAAMNAINVEILRSPFMPVFFGSSLATAVLAVIAILDLKAPFSAPALLGGAVYLAGMFAVTVIRNVPLNNALAAAEAEAGYDRTVWQRYLADWTRWNHVRTLASLAASGAYIDAISRL